MLIIITMRNKDIVVVVNIVVDIKIDIKVFTATQYRKLSEDALENVPSTSLHLYFDGL